MIRKTIDFLKLWIMFPGYVGDFLRAPYDKVYPFMRARAALHRRVVVKSTRMIAVTGSVGKTTTTRALKAVFQQRDPHHSHSNYGSCLAGNVLRTKPGDTYAVFEIGVDGPGKMAGYGKMVRPDIAVVTAVKGDHRRSFGTLENTREEKCDLVRALSKNGLAILNGDDPNVKWMAAQTKARVITYGFNKDNHVRATDIKLDWPRGTSFRLHAKGRQVDLSVKFIGVYMVYSILAAVAAGLAEGKPMEEITGPLTKLDPTLGRMQPICLDNGAVIIDDSFKGSYDSFLAAFDVFAEIPAKRKIVIMGAVTEPPGKQGPVYKELARQLSRFADRVFYIGGDQARRLKSGIPSEPTEGQTLTRADLFYYGTRIRNSMEHIKSEIRDGDVVLVKGTSTQHLRRITLALTGRAVNCHVKYCRLKMEECDHCPLLERDPMTVWNQFVRQDVRR